MDTVQAKAVAAGAAQLDPEGYVEPDVKDVHKAEAFLSDAQAGNEAERKMGTWEALKLYPKASAWSIAISFAVVMEGEQSAVFPQYPYNSSYLYPGYDVILLNNFYAFPAFVRRFGILASNGTYQIPAPWQAGMGNGATVGQIFGLLVCAVSLTDRMEV